MDIQVRKLTQEQADALRKQYQDSQQRAVGAMQVFPSEEDRREHLAYVAEFQANGGSF